VDNKDTIVDQNISIDTLNVKHTLRLTFLACIQFHSTHYVIHTEELFLAENGYRSVAIVVYRQAMSLNDFVGLGVTVHLSPE